MSSSASDVVRTTIGIARSPGSPLTSRSTARPSIRGRLRSSNTRSGRGHAAYSPSWRRNRMASTPSGTWCSVCWRSWYSNASRIMSSSPGSSSTSRTTITRRSGWGRVTAGPPLSPSGAGARPTPSRHGAPRRARRAGASPLFFRAAVRSRHVSFVETGRSRPSPEMVLHLAEQLDVPLRDRNGLLLAAGYAPVYAERDLEAPDMEPVRAALDLVLRGHEPYPAAVVDRTWELIRGNRGIGLLVEGVDPELLAPPVNVLRVSLHPRGMAPGIANLADWRAHLLERLGRQIAATGDPSLVTLRDELAGYPAPPPPESTEDLGDVCVPLRLRTPHGELSFISTIATFGTAVDITVAELAIESFFPADAATAEVVRTYVA